MSDGLWRPAGMPQDLHDTFQWRPGMRGHYESNYLKAHSPDGRRAVWIKHNILAPTDPARAAVVELWCVLFEVGRPPRVVRQTHPMSRVRCSPARAQLDGPDLHISPEGTRTTIVDERDGRTARWDITTTPDPGPLGEALIILPHRALYTLPFPRKKVITPAPLTRWEGWLDFDGQRLALDGWVGWRNHNWGTEHARLYAYGNCNLFQQRPDAIFEGFTARIRLGPVTSPPISAGVLRLGSCDHPFGGPGSLWRARSRVSFPRWELTLAGPAGRLRLTQEAPPEDFAALTYEHPDGTLSTCLNAKNARTRLRFEPRQGPALELTSQQGELEFLGVETPHLEAHKHP